MNDHKVHTVMFNSKAICANDSFVGIYNEFTSDRECVHAGLVICYAGSVYLFHSLFNRICLDELEDDGVCRYIIKLHIYNTEERVRSFLGHCKSLYSVITNDIVKSCFYFDNSYFTKDGAYFLEGSSTGLVLTTCVGFCLKVLDGDLLENRYLELADWDSTSLDKCYYDRSVTRIRYIVDSYRLDFDALIDLNNIKRVSPIELLTSGLFVSYPIRKVSIDSRIDEVSMYLSSISE